MMAQIPPEAVVSETLWQGWRLCEN